MSAPTVPPFSLTNERYDQSNFIGRLKKITSTFNPALLFATTSEVQIAKENLALFKEGSRPAGASGSDAALWDARTLLAARCHPDTGENIMTPFCFAAYAPMQPPIILGLLWPGASMPTMLFWQWYNQSYNVAVNYANRNASGTLSTTKLAAAYFGAVGAACGSAFGLSKLSDASAAKYPKLAPALRMGIPFISVVSAGTISLLVIRQQELQLGVPLRDHTGEVVGNSHAAAKEGLAKCALARVLWNIPVLIMPIPIMAAMKKTALLQKYPKLHLPCMAVTATICVCIGLYPAQAVFPQQDSIPASRVEPEFHAHTASDGKRADTFYYNKGL